MQNTVFAIQRIDTTTNIVIENIAIRVWIVGSNKTLGM